MQKSVLRLLGRSDYVPCNVPEMIDKLGWRPSHESNLKRVLRQLEHSGDIIRRGSRYVPAGQSQLLSGVIRMTRGGRGFFQPEDPNLKEIAIPENATGTALHGDTVLVKPALPSRKQSKKGGDSEPPTGTVERVVSRKRTEIVGTLQRGPRGLTVLPDDPRLNLEIVVPEPRDVGRPAHLGDKVVVELDDWESRSDTPRGEIIEVLGAPDAEGVDMLSILKHYNLPLHFPKPVLAEANSIAETHPNGEPTAEECQGRLDCRSHDVITIDPDDAKDFDDAICLQRSGENWILWVHIADVSHYVRPGTALDEEAKQRGNSTYLVDRVMPMLPEALSNEVCSLKPAVDRLTKCVEFLLTPEGRVLKANFHEAVIHSKRRFTYKEALAVIEGPETSDPVEKMVRQTHALAQKIRAARMQAGSLELDFPESKIRLDERGRVLRIDKIDNDVSHQLIEECMLLANEAVAGQLMGLNRPSVYRVHESPSDARLQEYRQDVIEHGIQCGNLSQRGEVQKLLRKLHELQVGAALKIGFLKSLMRARYAVEPLGHYGLSKAKYTHFTSPIRRYADLLVHRALFDQGKLSISTLKSVSEHISDTERNSSDAERDSKEVKLYAFLNQQIKTGELHSYPAMITDVRHFGFFVDVPTLGLSGLVPTSSVRDDYYMFDSARSQLIGRRTKRVIKLGDAITVQVLRVDTFKKQVDFQLATAKRVDKPVGEDSRREQPRRQEFRREEPRRQGSRPQGSRRPDARPQPPRRAEDSQRNESRPQTARHTDSRSQQPRRSGDSRRTDSGPQSSRRNDSRPQGPRRQDARPQASGRPDNRSEGARRSNSSSQGPRRFGPRREDSRQPESRAGEQRPMEQRQPIPTRKMPMFRTGKRR